MWPLHSPVKFSHVWVKTSICFPEQHLHSAWSQAVLTSTASDLHSRGNWRKRQMQLSSLKTSQDSEDSVLTLAEQKLKGIFSDPQLQRPEFSPHSALCLHLQLLQLSLPLWASKIASLSSSHHQMSVDETWPVCTHQAELTHGKSALIPGNSCPWRAGTQAHEGGMNNMGCCCSWSSEPWAHVGPACWMLPQAVIPPERRSHFTGRKWSEKGPGMER